ncbi:hypothetical protein JCM33374_g6496 [Metschnikowia sp. JCM 33374]|nr:hypothetical protein JCM33374_g6496 [Metschnikowia sp. JCM 33374]
MSAHEHFTKISLTKQELAHVYRQFFYASQAKIKQMLPGCTPHDEFSTQIQNTISKHLERTFEMAKHAMVVDGRDLAAHDVSVHDLLSIQERHEVVPFDVELNQQLRDLVETVEEETTEVTRLRRELPQQARDTYEQLVMATDEQVTAIVKETLENAENAQKAETPEQAGGFETPENAESLNVVAKSPISNASSGPETTPGVITDETTEEDEFSTELLSALASETSPIPGIDSVKTRFSESIGDLYALKKELSQLNGKFSSLNETVSVLMELYEKSKAEPRVYD